MAYSPSLSDVNEVEQYNPSLADLPDNPSIGNSLFAGLQTALQGASNPASLLPNALNLSGLDPRLVAGGGAEGIGRLYQGLYNLGTKIPGASSLGLSPSTSPINILSPQDENTLSAKIGNFAGGALGGAPLMAIPGLGEEALGGGILARMGLGAAVNAPIGAALNPDNQGLGAIVGGLGGLVGEGISGLPGIMRSALAGTKTPEQIQAAAAAVPPGINMPIGDITGSPSAKWMYGAVKGLPFSGAQKPYVQLNNSLQDMIGQLAPKEAIKQGGDNLNSFVYQRMTDAYEDSKDATNEAYQNLASAADATNTPFDGTRLNKILDDQINNFQSKMINKTSTELYSPLVDLLQDYRHTPFQNFQQAVDQIPVINDKLREVSSSNNRLMMNGASIVKSALNKSIEDSAQQNPQLLNLYNNALQARIAQGQFETLDGRTQTPFYKNYIRNNSNPPNLINSYIRPSVKGNDYSGILQNFVNTAPQDAVETARAAYLQPDNLSKTLSNLNDLSPTQKSLLFGEQKPLADQVQTLGNTFVDAKNPAFFPQTGYGGAHVISLAAIAEALAKEGVKKAAMTAAGFPAIAQPVQRFLRSPALLNSILNNTPSQSIAPFTAPLAPAALAAMTSGGNQ